MRPPKENSLWKFPPKAYLGRYGHFVLFVIENIGSSYQNMKTSTRDRSLLQAASMSDASIAKSKKTAERRSLFVLILLGSAQFMVALDFSIVNVALPAIQHDLSFTTQSLQWIVSAYSLTFGGFLLLSEDALAIYSGVVAYFW